MACLFFSQRDYDRLCAKYTFLVELLITNGPDAVDFEELGDLLRLMNLGEIAGFKKPSKEILDPLLAYFRAGGGYSMCARVYLGTNN